jgi:hypothetical protein
MSGEGRPLRRPPTTTIPVRWIVALLADVPTAHGS